MLEKSKREKSKRDKSEQDISDGDVSGIRFQFKPQIRDAAVDTICSNMAWCGLLGCRRETAEYVKLLNQLSDDELAVVLLRSRMLLDDYLARSVGRN